MRKTLSKILQILDGTPAANGNRRAGQSLVELALITPILIILFSGMVEIGWFANNYLTLLDTARAGARRGATLTNQNAPQAWNNNASYMPVESLTGGGIDCGTMPQPIGCMPYSTTDLFNPILQREQFARSVYRPTTLGLYPSSGCTSLQGFFNDVICTMVSSLAPLSLNAENGIDDIVVSAFSLELVDPATATGVQPSLPPPSYRPIAASVPQVVVVGRYPTNANECDAVEIAPGTEIYSNGMDSRDPFDFNANLRIDRYSDIEYDPSVVFPYVWNDHFSEVSGYDDNQININLKEKQVGFVWLGQHRITVDRPDGTSLQTLCLGSEFSIADIESIVNLTGYVPEASTTERTYLTGMGLVLVEIHWEHEMLLKLPVFNPVFDIMSTDGKPPQIYVWAAFPLPAADPTIIFH